MNVTRLAAAPAYEAPGHDGMRMLRLQGREAGPADMLWLGVSPLLPGGGSGAPCVGAETWAIRVASRLARQDHAPHGRPAAEVLPAGVGTTVRRGDVQHFVPRDRAAGALDQ